MIFKTRLFLSTAILAFGALPVLADGNDANLDQVGTGNTALITQSGRNNTAGFADDVHAQTGDNNALTVLQSGNRNRLGANGLDQRNLLDGSTNANSAEIVQSSNRNQIRRLTQVTRPSGANRGGNDIYIEQSGGSDNRLNAAVQRRNGGDAGNTASFTQTGRDNFFRLIRQDNDVSGRANSMTARFSGNETGREQNPRGVGDVATSLGDFSGRVLAEVNVMEQYGAGNQIDVDVSGNHTLLGIYQEGRGNSVGTVDVSGNRNAIGLSQVGPGNRITVAPVTGNANDFGVQQLGAVNDATVSIDGNRNSFGVLQAVAGNEITLTINGDNNGEGRPGAALLPNAGAVIGLGSSLGFGRGLTVQLGSNNLIEHEVQGDRNVFAFAQVGAGNTIRGSQTGAINMAAVVQVGPANTALFSQDGISNDLGITQ